MSDTGCTNAVAELRADLASVLRGHSEEIVATAAARVQDLWDADCGGDAASAAAMHAAVLATVEVGLAVVEDRGDRPRSVPPSVMAAGRAAAREGVDLERVLRCLAAMERTMGEYLVELGAELHSVALSPVLRVLGCQLDRLTIAIAAEYRDELATMRRSAAQRQAEFVQRLLAGDRSGAADIDYPLEGWHLGVVLVGRRAADAARALNAFGASVLRVVRGEHTVWVWIGSGSRKVAISLVEDRLTAVGVEISIAIGEHGYGLDGWRLTHAQAQAALWVSLRSPQPVARYSDVLLLSAVLRDQVLKRSLGEIYLTPLEDRRDGLALRETLRAYFASGHNVKASAARLNVDRGTVRRRLHLVEEVLGRSLLGCQAELEIALRLDELSGVRPPSTVSAAE